MTSENFRLDFSLKCCGSYNAALDPKSAPLTGHRFSKIHCVATRFLTRVHHSKVYRTTVIRRLSINFLLSSCSLYLHFLMVHLDKILIKSLLSMDRMPGSVLVAKDTAVNMASGIPAFTGLHPSKGTEIREAKYAQARGDTCTGGPAAALDETVRGRPLRGRSLKQRMSQGSKGNCSFLKPLSSQFRKETAFQGAGAAEALSRWSQTARRSAGLGALGGQVRELHPGSEECLEGSEQRSDWMGPGF